MLITEDLQKNKIKTGKRANKIYGGQRVKVKCDICGKVKEVSYRDYLKQHERRGQDLCQSCMQHEAYSKGTRESSWIEYNKEQAGKTLEERFGKERAEEIKKLMRDTIAKHGHYLTKDTETARHFKENLAERNKSKFLGKTYEEIYGTKKAKEIKKKLSKSRSGERNPMYGKPTSKRSGSGYQGWYKEHYFRSTLELSFIINFLEKNNLIWESGELRKYTIKYQINGIERTYRCDYVTKTTAYEIKPYYTLNQELNKKKFEAGKKFFNSIDKEYKVMTEKDFDVFDRHSLLEMHNKYIIQLNDKTLSMIEEKESC